MTKEITTEKVASVLTDVFDPEVGINVIDLGLVYDINIKDRDVRVVMTMTTPACPLSEYINRAAEQAIRKQMPEVMAFEIELVWSPEWNPLMMSQEARRQMGWRD